MDLGKTSLVKDSIRLPDNTLFKEHYWQIPPSMYEEFREHLKEILEIGATWPSHRLWASPVILVCKKDGKLWFCIDLRKLNAHTIKDSYRFPRIEDTLDSLNGPVWLRHQNHWWHSWYIHWDFTDVIVCLSDWWMPQLHSRDWWRHVWVIFSSTGVLSILTTLLYFLKCQKII